MALPILKEAAGIAPRRLCLRRLLDGFGIPVEIHNTVAAVAVHKAVLQGLAPPRLLGELYSHFSYEERDSHVVVRAVVAALPEVRSRLLQICRALKDAEGKAS